MSMRQGRLLIIGTGLIGTSIALAVRRAWPATIVTGIDGDAARHGRGDEAFHAFADIHAPVPGHDLAVLACPLDAMPGWMRRLAARPDPAPVTDVGGVKRAVRDAAVAAGLRTFVGGHPMAGAAVPGPALATATLFADRPWFVTTDHGTPAARAATQALIAACGAHAVPITSDDHDRIVAAVSHLPQVVSSVLMQVAGESAGEAGLAYAGGGLRDTTRLASSSPAVWRPVLAANRDHVAPLVADVGRRLIDLAGALDDAARVEALFAAAARARRHLMGSV